MALELAAASLLGAGFTQADRLLDLMTPLGQDKLLAERLQGKEQLSDGGFVLHVEQPQYTPDMPLFEQAMRDWDCFYNNEPFWSTLHEIDLDGWLVEAGFERDRLLHVGVTAVVDRDLFPDAADDDSEDFGRKAAWHVIGARK